MKKAITGAILAGFATINLMGADMNEPIIQTAGRDRLGTIAPKFAELNDDVLFGQVWARTDALSNRDRSLLTVTSLMTKGIFDSSLAYHIKNAREHGVTRAEMSEAITHLAFYSGWPNAWAAFAHVAEVYKDADDASDARAKFEALNAFGTGAPNDAYAKYFVGKSYLNPITTADSGFAMSNVTFEPGTRNNWHIHHATKGGGQVLICTAGKGWYQEEGKEPVAMTPGTAIVIPPNVKHWHGAAKDSWFSHIAFEVPGEGLSNEWLEPVESDLYK